MCGLVLDPPSPDKDLVGVLYLAVVATSLAFERRTVCSSSITASPTVPLTLPLTLPSTPSSTLPSWGTDIAVMTTSTKNTYLYAATTCCTQVFRIAVATGLRVRTHPFAGAGSLPAVSFAVSADAYGRFMGTFAEPLAQRFAASERG